MCCWREKIILGKPWCKLCIVYRGGGVSYFILKAPWTKPGKGLPGVVFTRTSPSIVPIMWLTQCVLCNRIRQTFVAAFSLTLIQVWGEGGGGQPPPPKALLQKSLNFYIRLSWLSEASVHFVFRYQFYSEA